MLNKAGEEIGGRLLPKAPESKPKIETPTEREERQQ